MTSVFTKAKEVQTAMMQKVQEALYQRDDMKTQMKEAFSAKEAVCTLTFLWFTLLFLFFKNTFQFLFN